jgi:tRNA-specific 2-thiouridylase
VGKDLDNNILIVAQGHNHPAMFHNTLETGQVNWIEENEPDADIMCEAITAKIRYRQPDQDCTLSKISNGGYRVSFTEAQRAVTPGQSVVFYHNEICLGGGIIETMYND